MTALEKLTLAYLVLQERAEKLQADKDAMFFQNQTLQAKYKKAAENNRFLQGEREKLAKQQIENTEIIDDLDGQRIWLQAKVDELVAKLELAQKFQNSIEKESSAQNEQIDNLKACVEELEGQCVELQARLDVSQVNKRVFYPIEPTDRGERHVLYTLEDETGYYLGGIDKALNPQFGTVRQSALFFKNRSEADFYADKHNAQNNEDKQCDIIGIELVDLDRPMIWDEANKTRFILTDDQNPTKYKSKAHPQQDGYEAEKRVCRAGFKDSETPNDADEKPVILLRGNQYGDWVYGKCLNERQQTELIFASKKERAEVFADLDKVKDFLDDYPLDNITITYHHPRTFEPVNVVSVTTEQRAADITNI